MIPKECKRLAEVDFALSAVNDACVEENNRKTRGAWCGRRMCERAKKVLRLR